MSKLYQILKEIESHRGKGAPAAGPDSVKSVRRSFRTLILIGLVGLSALIALGSFWVFKRFLYPSPPVITKKREIIRPIPVKKSLQVSPPARKLTSQPKKALPRKNKESKSMATPPPPSSVFPEKVVVLKSKKVEVKTVPDKAVLSKSPERPVKKESTGPPPLTPEERLRGFLVRAEALREKGLCREALPLYQKYLQVRKEAGVLNNYAACLWLEGRLAEAEKAFREALHFKEDPLVRLNLILLALQKGDTLEACQEYSRLRVEDLEISARKLYDSLRDHLRSICPPK